MTEKTPQSTSAAWNDHWKNTGVAAIDLFENSPVSNALRKFWNQVFIEHQQASTLDLGAGSGALAALALQSRVQVGKWLCLDTAESASTHWLKQKANLYNPTWIVGSVESCNPTAKVDLIVSNFGAEYADLNRVPASVRAWSRETTKIAWVVHAKNSIIDLQSQLSLADLYFLLDQTQFVAATLALIEQSADVPTDPIARMMHAVQERDRFNFEVNSLKTYMEQQNRRSPVLIECLQIATSTIGSLVQQSGDVIKAMQRFAGFAKALKFETERLEQMKSVALDSQKIQSLKLSLTQQGFSNLRIQQLHTQPPQQQPTAPENQPNSTLIAWVVIG